VHIVLLGEMRCGAVHHCGEIRRRPAAIDQDLARIIRQAAARLARKTGNRLNRPRTFPGERRAQPVDVQIDGALDNRRGDGVEAQLRGEGRQCEAWVIGHGGIAVG
jgi:hypothetical protein